MEIRVSNALFVGKGGPFSTRGGIRLGGSVDVKEEVAREEAVKVVEGADGRSPDCRILCLLMNLTMISLHLVAIVVVGLTHELESEGFDRPNMKYVLSFES